MKNRKTIFYILSGIGIVCISIALNVFLRYFTPNISSTDTILYVYEDDTLDEVINRADSIGIFKNINSFSKVANSRIEEQKIEAGRYKFKKSRDNRFIVNSLIHGWQIPAQLIIAGNIRNFEKLSIIISNQLKIDSLEMLNGFNDEKLMMSLGFNKDNYIAMILPNTYEVYWTSSPKTIIKRFKKEYDKFWTPERLKKAKNIGLSPLEVSTLASIVAEESNLKDEQPRIAGVYINRLNRGIPLQADPTVKYAHNDPSIKRILNKHLRIDSPYNTYKHRGLPPGPIMIPSEHTIDAVLNYEKHKFIYFCANSNLDGSHKFAKTLSEHNRNAKEYHRKITKMGIRK